jgi:hypothetical protein
MRFDTDESETFSSKIDIVEIMLMKELNFLKKLSELSMFDDEWIDSFSFWILEEFESNCIESLLEDIDLIDEVKEFEKNDERNWWNRESKNNIENERKKLNCFDRRNVEKKLSEAIFFRVVAIVISFLRSLFWFVSRFEESECESIEIEKIWLVDFENDSAECLVIDLDCDFDKIEIKRSKLRWTRFCRDW